MKKAVCSGSFDPITSGHVDIIRRAAQLFDEVIVLLSINPDKRPFFSVKERLSFIKDSTKDIPNVVVDSYQGLLVDYVRDHHVNVIVRGLRAMSDFEYEFQMALTNKELYPPAETVFLNTSLEHMYVSSSIVRNISQFGGDISALVPEQIVGRIKEKFQA